jgi:glycosyltransferase involved in cell wall biosynthesis
MHKNILYSIIIPVCNEKDSLAKLQDEIAEAMTAYNGEYEIIYVDDASTDGSEEMIKKLQKSFAQIHLVSFSKNCGQSAALLSGFRAAKGQWIITLDADGQNPPQEIPKLISLSKQKYDCITGVRSKRKDSKGRKIASSLAHFFRKLILGDSTKDTGCSLRMFKRSIIESLPFFKNFHRFFVFLIRANGFSVKEITVSHRNRTGGKTKYNNLKRFSEGLVDIWGAFWLKRRLLKYEIKK